MATITTILQAAPIANVLASNKAAEGSLFGGNIQPSLPITIFSVNKVLKKIYDNDPTYSGLYETSQRLWELCGRFGLQASAYTGGGGSSSSITPTSNFPIYITQADFTTTTFYPNTSLWGNTIMVFLNEINRYLDPATEFTYDTTGLTILVPGFDADTNDYTLIIEKVFN